MCVGPKLWVMFVYFEIESLHYSLATLLQLMNMIMILFVKMQQDTNTIRQSVIDYFNISKFCMNS